MSMLEEPIDNLAYAKIGLYGRAGSGKTFTATKLAIGLYKYANCNKPIAMFDTEPSYQFIRKYYEEAGIKFKVYARSRALADLMKFMEEAEKSCSIIIIDSITHIWRDVCDSYLKKVNDDRRKKNKKPIFRLEFHHWMPIKEAFGKFTDKYLTCKAHAIICGRAGDNYEYQKNDETNRQELITNGMKMAVEKEMGYEPSLLLEMFTERDKDKDELINYCSVIKDRSNNINGKTFKKPKFEDFVSHFDVLNLKANHFESLNNRDSKELFPQTGEDNFTWEARNREIWCEEIQGVLTKYYPSQKSEDKLSKINLIESVFNTRSWTKIQNTDSEILKKGFLDIKKILENISEQIPENITIECKESKDFFNEEATPPLS